jgi:cytochrome c oxidase subunit 3
MEHADVPGTVEHEASSVSAKPGDDATTPPAPTASDDLPPPEERSHILPPPPGPPGLAPETEVEAPPEHGPADGVPRNVQIFFGVYFMMTGLHGLHVLAGMAVLGWLLRRAIRGDFGSHYFTPVDLGGLYWHLVDLIWIFLFPLLYLID